MSTINLLLMNIIVQDLMKIIGIFIMLLAPIMIFNYYIFDKKSK
jgi:hypothetical protein